MISSRHLSSFLVPAKLEAVCRSIAMLDAILSPEWEYRYFSFNSNWDPAEEERMASMRNGSGDHFFAVFNGRGAIIKGFHHEAPMSPWSRTPNNVWPGVLDSVPEEFEGFLNEPAFSIDETTFCLWRGASEVTWSSGPITFPEGADPDGSASLLWMLDGNPNTYVQFARDYYECELSSEDVASIYESIPITREFVARLNTTAAWDDVLADAMEIGYPVSGT
jgi:hypothetical protein